MMVKCIHYSHGMIFGPSPIAEILERCVEMSNLILLHLSTLQIIPISVIQVKTYHCCDHQKTLPHKPMGILIYFFKVLHVLC